MADWLPARAKEHSPRQKRQEFFFAQGGLPPLSARQSLSPFSHNAFIVPALGYCYLI